MRKRVSHSGHCSAEAHDVSDAVVVKDTTPSSGLLDVLYTTLGGWLVEGQEDPMATSLPVHQQDPVATQPRKSLTQVSRAPASVHASTVQQVAVIPAFLNRVPVTPVR